MSKPVLDIYTERLEKALQVERLTSRTHLVNAIFRDIRRDDSVGVGQLVRFFNKHVKVIKEYYW